MRAATEHLGIHCRLPASFEPFEPPHPIRIMSHTSSLDLLALRLCNIGTKFRLGPGRTVSSGQRPSRYPTIIQEQSLSPHCWDQNAFPLCRFRQWCQWSRLSADYTGTYASSAADEHSIERSAILMFIVSSLLLCIVYHGYLRRLVAEYRPAMFVPWSVIPLFCSSGASCWWLYWSGCCAFSWDIVPHECLTPLYCD